MKKFSCFLMLLLIATCSFGQNIIAPPIKQQLIKTANFRHSAPKKLRGPGPQLAIDYDVADGQNYSTGDYLNFIWESNTHYSLDAQDPIDSIGMNYCIVAFDTLVDAFTFETYSRNQVSSVTIDTLGAVIGHVNHSGNLDTVRISVISLTNLDVLWTKDITTDTGLSISKDGFHSWVYSHFLVVPCGYTIPAGNNNAYGVKLEYFGDRRDTFGFLAGFGDPGLEGCGASLTKATQSAYYPNSYAYWVSLGALLPGAGGDIYYDCNLNGHPDANDGANYIQNIKLESVVTLNGFVTGNKSVADYNAVKVNTFPNPFNETSTFEVKGIQGEYNFTLSNVLGEKVQELTAVSSNHFEVNRGNLTAGIYFYSIVADGKAVANGKVVVQ